MGETVLPTHRSRTSSRSRSPDSNRRKEVTHCIGRTYATVILFIVILGVMAGSVFLILYCGAALSALVFGAPATSPATVLTTRSAIPALVPPPTSPRGYNEGVGPSSGRSLGYPSEYSRAFDRNDADVAKFNAAVYPSSINANNFAPPPPPPRPRRRPPHFDETMHIPAHISLHNPSAGREFTDEDLKFNELTGIRIPDAPGGPVSSIDTAIAADLPPTLAELKAEQEADPNNVSGGTEIPASAIAEDFPEYETPKTFSTERVDYNVRTGRPRNGEKPKGEEHSNVAVFSDDKSFHWSNGDGKPLPKNDPQFKDAMTWITGKFKGEKAADGGRKGKPAVRGGARKKSVFDVLTEF